MTRQSGDKLLRFPLGAHSAPILVLGEPYSVREYDPVLVLYAEFGVRRVRETYEDPEIIDSFEYFEVLGRVKMEESKVATVIEDGVEHVQVEPLEQEMKEWLKEHLEKDLGAEMAKRVCFAC